MKSLIDTHALLWFAGGSPKLSSTARRRIEDVRGERYVSVASIWEIAIKVSLGRLRLDAELGELVATDIVGSSIAVLDVRKEHAVAVARLPFHHRDPFDRLLVAQAIVEGLDVVTADPAFAQYGVKRVW